MIEKSAWMRQWGLSEGTAEGEAAWTAKVNFRPQRLAPFIMRDSIAPVRGMDGKMHDSLSGLRKTYRSDGNPQGETYTEIGDQELPTVKPTFDRKTRRDDIRAAIEDVKNGYVPPLTVLED